jgi:hypothetical protein
VVAGRGGGLELADVAGDYRGVETELLAPEHEVVGARIASQGVKRLRQGLSTAGIGGLRPKEAEQLVTAQTVRAGHREGGEHGEPARLECGADQGLSVANQLQSTERA